MISAYKLLRKRKDGSIGPLFINCKDRLPIGQWMKAECHPTKGFAVRKGWHALSLPIAPHLSTRDRVWYVVELKGVMEMDRPKGQGGLWYIANQMRIIKEVV